MPHRVPDEASGYAYYIEEQMVVGVLSLGAHVSKIKYSAGGIEYEVFADNADLIFWNEEDDNG